MPATADNLSLVRHLVGEHLVSIGADGRTDDVQLAVHEAIANVVRHAYEDEPGDFDVELKPDDDGVDIVVRDEGCGPSGRKASSDSFGMGVPIMKTLADSLSIEERPSTGTEVQMRFLL